MRKLFILLIVVLILGTTTSLLAAPPTQDVSGKGNLEDIYTITCDTGEEISGGLIFTFVNINPGTRPRVTAIGIDGFDPVLAIVTEPGVGSCNDDTARVKGSQVALPGLGLVNADEYSAQVTVNAPRGGNIDVVVGGYQGASGRFALVVEELAINPRDELDGFLISVPEALTSEPIGVFMVRRNGGTLDPYMEVYGGAGLQGDPLDFNNVQLIAACDDAGVGDCSDTPSFPGGGTDITNGYRYEAGSLDAGLVYSLGSTDKYLYAFGSSGSGSSGNYGIIVVGAVGAPSTTASTTNTSTGNNAAAGCTNVATKINSASSTYSDSYKPEFLLDGDGTTGWSSAGIDEENFVIVGFDSVRTVSEVRFNSYSTSAGFENDSIKDFSIVILSADGKLQTVLDATARQAPGYQTYTFPPVQTNQLGFLFTNNYGGNYFAAADILVCGQ